MRNLTFEEAGARAAALTVSSYKIELDLTQGDTTFLSRTTVVFRAEPGTSTFLELDCASLISAMVDGRPLSLEGNRIALDGLGGDHVAVVEAHCAYTRSGEGLHRFVDPADDRVYVYAQAFLDDAQRIFACFDQPDLKATMQLSVRADDLVLSNTRGKVIDGVHVFEQTVPLSTYHVTLAAGPWHGQQTWYDEIELGVWCRASLGEHLEADELFAITKDCFAFQQRMFGSPYPFGDTYDQVFVPEFNAGAMENPGMVTFTDEGFIFRSRTTEGTRRLRAQVIAHEMAHMWFGDLVTMRWWDGIWLNESFAEFMGVETTDEATRFSGAWSDFCVGRKAWGYRADQLPTTHPVAGFVSDNRAALQNFDGISYAKGASVLRQLVAYVGQDTFFTGLRAYLAKHAFGNTDLGDLLAELEVASGADLTEWSRSWLTTTGVATLRPWFTSSGLVIEQESEVQRSHVIEVGFYDDVDGVLRLRERVSTPITGPSTALDGARPADLVLVNDRDLTFAKIRFDERSLQTVLSSLGRIEDQLARALCWGALWDAVRDAELPARDYVAAVLASVGAEDDPSLVETLLGQAIKAAGTFAPVSRQDGLLRDIAAACWTAPVEPGSDLQLVRVRAAASSCTDSAQLLALLDGSAAPEGLVIDTELRWHLVRNAAALGAIGDAEIVLELAADPTASGELQAISARAAQPSADAKAAAWEILFGGTASNAHVRAAGSAFWQRGQEAFLEPYVDRYLSALPGLWESSSPQLAAAVTTHGFPSTLISDSVTARVQALLDRDDLAPGMRRVVLEQHDDLARVLRAQSAAPV
jgi:aminopeptidase N